MIPRKIAKKKLELENPEAEFEGVGEEDGGASDASDGEENEEAQVGSEAENEKELAPGSLVCELGCCATILLLCWRQLRCLLSSALSLPRLSLSLRPQAFL